MQGEAIVLTTRPSTATAISVSVQLRLAVWKLVDTGADSVAVEPLEHGALPLLPSMQPHLAGRPLSGVSGSPQIWTWLGTSVLLISLLHLWHEDLLKLCIRRMSGNRIRPA